MSHAPSRDPARILVVDDVPANVHLLLSELASCGHRVFPVRSGKMALHVAARERPDLVLLDINMPEMSGYEVCQALKQDETLRGVPVIFVSALAEPFDKVRAFAAGGVDYVTKPFHLDEVRARVETHLALRRATLDLADTLERLRALEETRKAIAAAIVHDVKSPLAALRGSAEYLLEREDVQGEVREVLGEMVASSNEVLRIVLNLLDVARVEDTAIVPRREQLRLGDVLESVRATAKLATRISGHHLCIDADAELELSVDADQVTRLLENLIDNAAKYAPPATTIRVVIRGDGQRGCSLRVEDAGPGVPSEERARVFEPGVRLAPGQRIHSRASRGLGLAFCRLAVEAHGGRIWIEDNEPGAAFCAVIPGGEATTAEATSAADGRPAAPARSLTARGT